MKRIVLLLALLASGCAPYHYPAGTTPYQKWQIDRYYEDRRSEAADSFMPKQRRYCNNQFCW